MPIIAKPGMVVRSDFALARAAFVKKAIGRVATMASPATLQPLSFSAAEAEFIRDFNEFYVDALQNVDILVLGNTGRRTI